MTDYLRNTWYVAGWSDELKPDQLLPRRLLDQPVVLFRDDEGQARARQLLAKMIESEKAAEGQSA